MHQECLELELASQGIEFLAQQEIGLSYKGRPLRQTYRADSVCFGKVIVEIKAVSALTDGQAGPAQVTPSRNLLVVPVAFRAFRVFRGLIE